MKVRHIGKHLRPRVFTLSVQFKRPGEDWQTLSATRSSMSGPSSIQLVADSVALTQPGVYPRAGGANPIRLGLGPTMPVMIGNVALRRGD